MSYYTYLWKNSTWDRKSKLASEGYAELDYAASDNFKSAGVFKGDKVFIVTVREGVLYLGGLILVADVLNKRDASVYLGVPESSLWEAKEYIVAARLTAQIFKDNIALPTSATQSLQFAKDKGFTYLKFEAPGILDRQTLRNVRKIYPDSESILESFLLK